MPGQGPNVYRIRPTGGEPEKLTEGDGGFTYPGWLDPDSLVVFHSPSYDEKQGTPKKLDLRTHQMTPLPELGNSFIQPSPDGKYFACISRDSTGFPCTPHSLGQCELSKRVR